MLLLLILSCWHISALDIKSTLKVYHSLFASILKKQHFSVYTDNSELKNAFSQSDKISLASSPSSANIVVASRKDTIIRAYQSGTIVLTTKYSLLDDSTRVIGALYWRKGRSQLLFVRNRLQQQGITLPKQYSKFIVDNL